jgi:uncharacterized membrane protein
MPIGMGVPDTRGAARLETAGLALLYAFTGVALVGYILFGQNPSRLQSLPVWAAAFYGRSFGFFAQTHVWLAMTVLATVLVVRAGTQWLAAFVAVYVISLAVELVGTSHDLPFGAYEYGALLGPKWLDRVPIVIPLSWFFMAIPSYALSVRAVRGRIPRVVTASLMLLAWDLALDPAMTHAARYWQWADTGPYYGMPWLNLFGWYVTGVLLMSALAWLRAEQWTARFAPRFWGAFYGANMLLPLGMCAAAGLWTAVLATLLVVAAVASVLLAAAQRPMTVATLEQAP